MGEAKTEEAKAIAVNVNRVIKKRSGDPLRISPEFGDNFEFCDECAKKVTSARGEKVTVKSVIVDALDSIPREPQQGEKKISGSEKLRRGLLAEKIYGSDGPVELPIDDLALIKKLVGEMQTPLVVSQVFPEIDPKTKED